VPPTTRPDYRAILHTLNHHRVDYLIVGGVAAVLHGAPLNTLDLDVVHSREPANIERLLQALEDLDAYSRLRKDGKFRPDASHLSTAGHQLLTTRYGAFDLLGSIGAGQGYEDLVNNTTRLDAGEGVEVRVLNLDLLIRFKEEAGRDKDRAALPTLRRTLEEKKRLGG